MIPIRVDKITVCKDILDEYAIKRYLDQDVRKYGYQPIQFTVYNQSDRYLLMSSNLPVVPPVTVAVVPGVPSRQSPAQAPAPQFVPHLILRLSCRHRVQADAHMSAMRHDEQQRFRQHRTWSPRLIRLYCQAPP